MSVGNIMIVSWFDDHDVVDVRRRGGEPVGAVVMCADLVAAVWQAAFEHVGQSFVVFDHQHPHSARPADELDDG